MFIVSTSCWLRNFQLLTITPVTTVKRRYAHRGTNLALKNGRFSNMEAMPRVYRNAVKVQQKSILLVICVWFFCFESQKGQKKADTPPPQETRKHIPTKQGSFWENHRRLKSAKVYGRGYVIVPRVGSVWSS